MAAAVPTAATCMAAGGAGSESKTALRRRQRQATVRALRARVECGQQRGDGLAAELVHRLLLVAPVLAAGLCGAEVATLVRRRRNAAVHVFDVAAASIAVASSSALNRYQRGGGRCESTTTEGLQSAPEDEKKKLQESNAACEPGGECRTAVPMSLVPESDDEHCEQHPRDEYSEQRTKGLEQEPEQQDEGRLGLASRGLEEEAGGVKG